MAYYYLKNVGCIALHTFYFCVRKAKAITNSTVLDSNLFSFLTNIRVLLCLYSHDCVHGICFIKHKSHWLFVTLQPALQPTLLQVIHELRVRIVLPRMGRSRSIFVDWRLHIRLFRHCRWLGKQV